LRNRIFIMRFRLRDRKQRVRFRLPTFGLFSTKLKSFNKNLIGGSSRLHNTEPTSQDAKSRVQPGVHPHPPLFIRTNAGVNPGLNPGFGVLRCGPLFHTRTVPDFWRNTRAFVLPRDKCSKLLMTLY
jgi:hypothetical protein